MKLELTICDNEASQVMGALIFLLRRHRNSIDTVHAHEDELVDQLLRQANERNLELDALDIVCVTNLVNEYFLKLGVVGEEISDVTYGEIESTES